MNVVLTTLNAKYIHSSLALRYLKAYAQEDFPNSEIREYTIKDPPGRIVADLYTRKPDVIAFSVYIWNVEETLPLLAMLKKVLPNTVIVLGGPEVSYDTREWLARVPEVDFIVQGEGEATFHHLLTTLASLTSPQYASASSAASSATETPTATPTLAAAAFADIPGLAFRNGERIQINPPRAKLALEEVPSPYQDEADLQALRGRVVYFESSRGCPFSCQFCLSSIESGVRYFPIERVKAELMRLMEAGIGTVKFVDRTFNLHRRYALEMFQFLIDQRKNTVFQFEITGDILPKEIVDFLAVHAPQGLFRFEIGVQSTNDVTNSLVQRKQNFERLSDTIRSVKASEKIVQHLDLIAGLPEEDYGSFRKTFDDVFAFEPDELQLGFLKMLRGTGMRRQAADFGYVFMDNAPYEILFNNILSYDDVLRIKQVEDVLEKYWNEGKLRHTVQYLTRHVFQSAFDFFQDFGSYWEAHGWDRIGHQLEDLFLRLDGFLREHCETAQHQAARAYMMYDFLLQYRVRPHKLWWQRQLHQTDKAALLKEIFNHPDWFGEEFEQLGLTAVDLEKHTVVEALPRFIYPLQPDRDPNLTSDDQSGLLLVYYPPGLPKGERPRAFTARLPMSYRAGDLQPPDSLTVS